MKLSIKQMDSMDIGHVRKMMKDFVKELGLPYPVMDDQELDKAMMQMLTTVNNPDYVYLIAFDGKKPAGFAKGTIYDKAYGKPSRIGLAQELYVVPGKRGKIVGYKLVKECFRIGLERGVEAFESVGVYGTTDKRWERYGFTPYLVYGHMDMNRVKKIIGGRSEDYKSNSD